ncbi:hypothetical protein OPU71_21085 [Niveibacterium sp. 24ML]|uniref:hypothetical protein n=1 Tax=Niveibacterium sp. 24ML TaxID=2985512 RepID=UPI00226E10C4|nr:hypothetical protein [Niveibacterium sp. 24ML]MCX9158616.1 hypothetical protein [Niveibacterium sp. 24ML]
MAKELDLALEAYSFTNAFSPANFADIARQLSEKHPESAEKDVQEAAEIAVRLHELVQKNPLYNEPFSTAREKAEEYLRSNLPGLSEGLYFHAQNRIMQMYLH